MKSSENTEDYNFDKILSNLTLQENNILHLAKDGIGNKIIAKKCNISVRTVKQHRRNIMQKSELKGKPEMTKFLVAFSNWLVLVRK